MFHVFVLKPHHEDLADLKFSTSSDNVASVAYTMPPLVNFRSNAARESGTTMSHATKRRLGSVEFKWWSECFKLSSKVISCTFCSSQAKIRSLLGMRLLKKNPGRCHKKNPGRCHNKNPGYLLWTRQDAPAHWQQINIWIRWLVWRFLVPGV